jgi:hypothetical protein
MPEARKLRVYSPVLQTGDCSFWERRVTLGCVHGDSITFAQGKGEKEALLKQRGEPGVTLFVAWTGQYTTDIFYIDDAAYVEILATR